MGKSKKAKAPPLGPATLDDIKSEIQNLSNVISKSFKKATSAGIHAGMKSGSILGATELDKELITISKSMEDIFKGKRIARELTDQLKKAFVQLKGAVGKDEFKGLKKHYDELSNDLSKKFQTKPQKAAIAATNAEIAALELANAKAIAAKKNTDLIKSSFSGMLVPIDKMIERLNKIPVIGKFLGDMVTIARDEIIKKLNSDLMKGLVDGVMNFAKAWPKTMIVLGLVVLALAAIVNKFIAVQKAVQKVADDTGVINDGLIQIQTQMVSTVRSLGVYGVTLEVAGAAWASIYKIQGMTGLESQKLVNTTALMVSNLGMTADDAANALITFRAMGNATDAQAASMVAVVANAAEMAGMSPAKIIGDMAKNSKFLMTYMRDSGNAAVKLAMQSERMGISLESAAKSTSDLLEWETSIEDEMNATVMLGRQITFQKARALAFDGKIAESQQAVFEQLPKLAEWNTLNFIQKKAIAKAAGMEADEIGKSLKQQDMISKLGYKEQQQYKDAIASLEKMQEMDGESMLRDKQKQVALTTFTQAWDGLMSQIGLFFMPFFEKVLIPGLDLATRFIRWISSGFTDSANAAAILGTIIVVILGGGMLFLIWKMVAFILLIKKAAAGMVELAAANKLASVTAPPSVGGGVTAPTPGAGGGIGGFFKSIDPMSLIKGAAALLIAAAAIYVLALALNQFNTVEWLSLGKAALALIIFGVALNFLQPLILALIPAVSVLWALGGAVLLFGLAVLAAGAGMKLFSEAMTSLLPQFISLAGVAPQLILASLGIYAISAALVAFALVSAGAGLTALFALAPFMAFASISKPLALAAVAIESLTKSLKEYSDLDAGKIANVTNAVTGLVPSPLARAVGSITNAVDSIVGGSAEKGADSVAKNVNELIAYFKNGSWEVNIDGKKAGDIIFSNYHGNGVTA